MNKEEQEAIDKLKRSANYFVMSMYETEVILNLIEKQQKEIEKTKDKNNELLKKLRNRVKEVKKLEKYSLYKKEFSRLNKQLEKKDKVIDEIAIELYNYANLNKLGVCEAEQENGNYNMDLCKMSLADRNCCDCIKQYFTKKGEEK